MLRKLPLLAFALSLSFNPALAAPSDSSLALDDIVGMRSIDADDAVNFAPGGGFVSATHCQPSDHSNLGNDRALGFSRTGVPVSSGPCELHDVVYDIESGDTTELTPPGASSWGGSWSHDGRYLAYYSDRGGQPGLWLWDKELRASSKLGDVQPRPFWKHQHILWSPDDLRLYLKRVSKMGPDPRILADARLFERTDPEAASLVVYRNGDDANAQHRSDSLVASNFADLVEVDRSTGSVHILAEGKAIGGYKMSTDGKLIIYAEMLPVDTDYDNRFFKIHRLTLQNGEDRILAPDIRLEYGDEFAISPTGADIAIASIQDTPNGRRRWVDFLSTGVVAQRSRSRDLPGGLAVAPIWTEDARNVLVLGDGTIWKASLNKDEVDQVWQSSEWKVLRLYGDRPPAGDGKALALLHSDISKSESVTQLDLANGGAKSIFADHKMYFSSQPYWIGLQGHTMAEDGSIVLLGGALQKPADLWLLKGTKLRRLSHLNPGIEHYQYISKVIHWRTKAGKDGSAALLLPSTWQPGTALPTVVWIYPGDMPSRRITSYGLSISDAASQSVTYFTSLGYAVLAPDAPFDGPTVAEDTRRVVAEAVDAAVAQGFVDPDRMALRGQSFGSLAVWNIIGGDHRFKAAITTGNVLHPDLEAAYLTMLPDGTSTSIEYWERGQAHFGGSLWEKPEVYRDNSPVKLLDEVTTPLLMAQGSADSDRFNAAADAVYVALRRLGKTVEYRLYEDEGHVIYSKTATRDFLLSERRWLETYVGRPEE